MPEPTVLLVSDEPRERSSMRSLLRKRGYRVITARASLEAFALAATQPIDALIVKENLPGVPGAEVGRILSQTFPGLSVIHLIPSRSGVEVADELDGLIADRRKPASRSESRSSRHSRTA